MFPKEKKLVQFGYGTIDEDGMHFIRYNMRTRYNVELPDWWPNDLIVRKGDYCGSLGKRLKKFLHSEKIKADDQGIGYITNKVAQNYATHELKYWVDFTQRFDWCAGQFGDDDSCFWGCRSNALPMLQRAGAWAIRFYEEDFQYSGCGRAWIVPSEHANECVVFNFYGPDKIGLWNAGRLVSETLGHPDYQRVELYNNADDNNDDTIWVNGNRGIYCGNHGSSPYYMEIEEFFICSECGGRFTDMEDRRYDGDDGIVCISCHDEEDD